MIVPEDDFFHRRTDDPYWNESAWFGLMIPERKIHGFVYFWHRNNMQLTAAGTSWWDPSGADVYDCLFHEFENFMPLHKGAEMFDFTSDNGLTSKCVDPLSSYRLDYVTAGCEVHLDWRGITEPNEAPASEPGVLHPSFEGWAGGHYEQGGRAQGVLILDGERIEIDHFSTRDHSWGPRRVRYDMPRQGFEWGFASEGHSFCVHAVNDIPAEKDSLEDTVEREIRGWYMKDGIQSGVNQGERRVVERGLDGRPKRILVAGVDDLGRSFRAEGECVNLLRYHYMTLWLNNWCLVDWDLDGVQAWGEDQDFVQLRQHRAYLRRMQQGARQGS